MDKFDLLFLLFFEVDGEAERDPNENLLDLADDDTGEFDFLKK